MLTCYSNTYLRDLVRGFSQWPAWNVTNIDGVGSNIVFHTAEGGVFRTFVEKDDYRLAQTQFIDSVMHCQMFY